jgi:AraC-like DNA-binding protein
MAFLPPRVQHAFRRQANRRPVCLVLDFDWRGAQSRSVRVTRLPENDLHAAREQIARIAHCQRQSASEPPLHVSALILALLEMLLGATVIPRQTQSRAQSALARKLHLLFTSPDAASLPLNQLARLAGYQHDYLNRLLKQDEGLTLGQMRAHHLLAEAQRRLPQAGSIADVAEALGFSDPNYFARWFRKHTGVSPTQWRRNHARHH